MTKKFCILQVEDDENDVFFLQHAFQAAGIPNPLQVTRDGQEAIDYLSGVGKFANREKFPLPDLMLLDLKLPHVMGLEVLKWIRQQSGMTLAVVVLTASGEAADVAAEDFVLPGLLNLREEISRHAADEDG